MLKSKTWVFYPFVGLTVTADKPKQLHKEFTLLSGEGVRSLADRVQSKNRRFLKTHGEIAKIVLVEAESCDSYLAIPLHASDKRNIMEQTEPRAQLASDLLTVAYYSLDLLGATCTLYENRPKVKPRTTYLSDSNKITGFKSHQPDYEKRRVYRKHFQQDYAQIKATVFDPSKSYAELSLGATTKQSALVQTSVRLLASAILAEDWSVKLLHAVTSIEVLLSADRKSNYEDIELRLLGFVRPQLFDFLMVKEVLRARHAFVHAGVRLIDGKLASKAIQLALAVIHFFSEMNRKGVDKESLLPPLKHLGQTMSLWYEEPKGSIFSLIHKGRLRAFKSSPFHQLVSDIEYSLRYEPR